MILKVLVWLAFVGDVVFLVGYAVIPPRSWRKYAMGWHLVLWSAAFGAITGTTAVRTLTGPLPQWVGLIELSAVVAVIWWRTLWSLYLKFGRERRVSSGDEGGQS